MILTRISPGPAFGRGHAGSSLSTSGPPCSWITKVTESRRKPNGTVLRWSFATIEGRGLLPHVPGFIEWEGMVHPGQDAPKGCNLVRLEIEARRPENVRAFLAAFRLGVDVREGDTEGLHATLDTVKGRVELS